MVVSCILAPNDASLKLVKKLLFKLQIGAERNELVRFHKKWFIFVSQINKTILEPMPNKNLDAVSLNISSKRRNVAWEILSENVSKHHLFLGLRWNYKVLVHEPDGHSIRIYDK